MSFVVGEAKAKVALLQVNGQSKLTITSEDAASLLKGLGIYKNIKGGELNVVLTRASAKKAKLGLVYVGEAEIVNFTATKTPILAKLVSFSSFRGILSILKNYRSIPFKKMSGKFVIADNMVRINQTYFSGDYLTLTLNGIIDINNEYIDFYGKVVPPVYGFNHVLSLIPFLGHEIPGSNGQKGLIAAKYTIRGKFGNTNAFVNPLGMVLPEIFDTNIADIFLP